VGYASIYTLLALPVKGAYDKGEMEERLDSWALKAVADAALERAAAQLREVVKGLAGRLNPFPSFLGLRTIQAIEVEPGPFRDPKRGCVVVCPDGELYELTLRLIPGPTGVSDVDQIEEFRRLETTPLEYIVYARGAIQALSQALAERGL
jgi:hypothetical protein